MANSGIDQIAVIKVLNNILESVWLQPHSHSCLDERTGYRVFVTCQ